MGISCCSRLNDRERKSLNAARDMVERLRKVDPEGARYWDNRIANLLNQPDKSLNSDLDDIPEMIIKRTRAKGLRI